MRTFQHSVVTAAVCDVPVLWTVPYACVYVTVINSHNKKKKHLFYSLNNPTDQLLMTCFLITFKDYWYLTNMHQFQHYFSWGFLPSYKSHLHARFQWDLGKKSTYHFSTWAIHFKSVIKMLPSLLLCILTIFKTKYSIKNNLNAEKMLHSDYTSTLLFGFIQNSAYRHSMITHIPFWLHTLHKKLC